MRPDRIVIGTDNEHATQLMRTLYAPFQRNHERLITMDIRSAELTKYAANAMLATRISFMNELANLAEKLGADIENVRHGIGSDPRIGYHFLYPGCGYGGSCFPKDVQALASHRGGIRRADACHRRGRSRQRCTEARLLDKIIARFGNDLQGKTFAVWGLAFKPNTDDMREAPSRVLMEGLWARGAKVIAHDPAAAHETQRIYGDASATAPWSIIADGGIARCGCAGDCHRVESIPQPGFQRDESRAEDAADF